MPPAKGEHDAFRQQLTDDACTARAHWRRESRIHACGRWRAQGEDWRRGAGDEQNEADGPEQDEERLTSAGDDGVAQRLDPKLALVSISSG